jgi:hypothetical protein
MHASIACLLLYEDYVWVSLGNAMKAKQSKATMMIPPLAVSYDRLTNPPSRRASSGEAAST